MINMHKVNNDPKSQMSPLKRQTRVVAGFPSADGYAVASIEGRVAIQFVYSICQEICTLTLNADT